MNAKLIALIVVFVTNIRICQCKKYNNYALITVTPKDGEHLKFLQNVEKQKYIDLIFWKRPHKLYHDVQFIVNPSDRDLFIERANHYKMRYEVPISDIQRAFDNQTLRRYLRLRVESYSWEHYHSLEDIYQWLSDLALKFPDIVELYTIGKSAEGREIYALGITRGRSKYKAIIEGGIHGNEWISVEYVTYLISKLLNSKYTDGNIYYLAMQYKWFLIPILNPDGYDFSQKEDRLWRKNKRSVNGGVGIDLNKNFAYAFGSFDTSKDPKDSKYCGPSAFSEPETKALSNFVLKHKENLKFYFSFHGYGQKIIIPYSDRVNHQDDYSEMENYGKQAVVKIYKYNKTKYAVGTYYDTMGHRISGNSASWVKKSIKVKYVFTFVLRDNGSYGYALPTEQIAPTCEEALHGMAEIMVARQRRVRANLFGSSAGLTLNRLVVSLCTTVYAMIK